jgi:hypothetical protein
MIALHIILGIVSYIFWGLVGIAFPVYAIARAANLGYRSGVVVRLPAKLFAGVLFGYTASSAAAAAEKASSNICYQLEYSADRFYTITLPVFVVVLLVSRLLLFEPTLDNISRRKFWSSRARAADGIAGAVLETLAAVFVLDIFLLSVGFRNSPVDRLANVLGAAHFPGASFLANLPYLFGGVLQLQQKLHAGNFAYAHLMQRCPATPFTSTTYSGIYLWTVLLAVYIFAPLAFAFSFQSIARLRRTNSGRVSAVQSVCEECRGEGTYGPERPLLCAGLCERCLGTGEQVSSEAEAMRLARMANPPIRSLIIRTYFIAVGIYTVLPILVLLMYAGIRNA